MRKTYRARDVKDYWEARWLAIPADAPMQNETKYPLKYSIEMIRDDKSGSILEAGCGAGTGAAAATQPRRRSGPGDDQPQVPAEGTGETVYRRC